MPTDLFPLDIEQRPENRRRRHEGVPLLSPSPDGLPRSEAFFEDLDPAPLLQAVLPGPAAWRAAA
jgi:hypothetical protein